MPIVVTLFLFYSHKIQFASQTFCDSIYQLFSHEPYFAVHLAYRTSVASDHREVKEDVPILCNECAKGLSDAVDKYLISGGAKRKFERE